MIRMFRHITFPWMMPRMLAMAVALVASAVLMHAHSHAQSAAYGYDSWFEKVIQNGPGKEEIQDPFESLRNHPELKKELSDRIHSLEEKYQFTIRVIIRPIFMSSTPQELAIRLQDAWFPKGNGLVMVIETDTRRLGLELSLRGEPDEEDCLVPSHASIMILQRVLSRINRDLPIDEYLRSLILDVIGEHEAYLAKRTSVTASAQTLRENLFMIGALCTVALGALVVMTWMRYSRAKEAQSVRRFPRFATPIRLGAPYGGGMIATRKFDQNNS
jgi:uncharacterized membrane protein YgcG